MDPSKLLPVPALLALALTLLLPAPGLAWSRFAHEVTGHLAEGDLSPVARAAVAGLLDGQGLADVGSWADQVRPDRPETVPLHYVNGPMDVLVPSAADFNLPQGNVYSAVLGYSERIADVRLEREQRVEALKFLVHFLADLHQPLHSGFAEDRGANDVPALYRGEVINLHRYWDNQIFASVQAVFDSRQFAAVLRARHGDHERRAWAASAPRDWVIEARGLIFNGLYPRPRGDALSGLIEEDRQRLAGPIAVLDESYRSVWQPVAERQLARAGARLAAALNHIFEAGRSPFAPPPIPFPPSPPVS
ncbi:MAG: S1/P1 nuclease [Xanthomonadaceae bacterium]|nr:S1/P1 nuclease [Xanthomonadaceae bacterium]